MTDTNDLPPLPDGWEWTKSTSGADGKEVNVASKCNEYREVYVEAGDLTISANYDIDYAPAEVAVAVLRANGYNFTS